METFDQRVAPTDFPVWVPSASPCCRRRIGSGPSENYGRTADWLLQTRISGEYRISGGNCRFQEGTCATRTEPQPQSRSEEPVQECGHASQRQRYLGL